MLDDVYYFVKEYWTYIVTAISCFISLIISILKNRHNNKVNKFLELLEILPAIINKSEQVFALVGKSGQSKLDFALSQIEACCTEYHINFDRDFWCSRIEAYLTTPQKK